MKKGINEGMPLPLYCTWYIVSKDSNEFIVIEHVSGACYQASVDDIGYRYSYLFKDNDVHRICVHAIPASDAEEYQGMPMFAEVGPLLMDEQILLKANNVIEKEELISFQIQLEKVQQQELLSQPNLKFPLKCQLILKRDQVKFHHSNEAIMLIEHLGNNINFLIVKHVNNKVEIKDKDEQTFAVFTMKNNIERDLFMLVYRNFKQNAEQFLSQQAAAQQLLDDQQQQVNIEEDKLDEQKIELEIQKQQEPEDSPDEQIMIQQEQIKQLTQDLEQKIQQNQQLEANQGELEKQIQQFRHNYAKKIEEINQQSEEIRKFESEVNFYKQEVSLVQNENQKLKKKIGKMKNKLEVMTTNTLSNTPSEYSSTRDESISHTREICVQTNEDGLDDQFTSISKQEALQTIKQLEAERDKINGERNHFKKNLDSMKQDYDKLLKKQQQLDEKQPVINESIYNNTLSNVAQTSQILCGGCGAEILDHSFKSDQFVYSNATAKANQLDILNKRPTLNTNSIIIQSEETKQSHQNKKKKNIRSVYGQYESKEGIEEKIQEVINLSQNNHHMNKSISLEGEQDIQQQNQLLYSDGIDQNIFESGKDVFYEDEDTQLVNDFVKKMSITMTQQQQYNQQQIQPAFPEERLMLLIDENTQMKQDLEAKLDKIQQYQYLVDEHKRALDDEIKKCNQYKQLLGQQKGFSLSIGGNNKQLDQMNKLINNLTVMIGEKDEELQIQKNINRELSRKVQETDKRSKEGI